MIAYTPAQQQVIDVLGGSPAEHPQFDWDLRRKLRLELERGIAPLADAISSGAFGDSGLFISKHNLAALLGCEKKLLAEWAKPFEWSPPLARGTISHKAIELAINWRVPSSPLELVDEAMDRMAEGNRGIGGYLRTCSDVDWAELRSEANERVTKFLECFPPLKRAWVPVLEARLRLEVPQHSTEDLRHHPELMKQRVVLSGKPDLTLGKLRTRQNPKGAQGAPTVAAGKVIIDFKTGGFSPVHREDLRFYALLEAVRLGAPPRKVATYYLDSGDIHSEDVTVDVLQAASRRVIQGVTRCVELITEQPEPTIRPGPACRWCPVSAGCEEGLAYLDARSGESEAAHAARGTW